MSRKNKEKIGIALKILLGVAYAFPVIMCVLFSFQANTEINKAPLHLFTKNPTLENYRYVLENIPILTYLKNTVIIIVITVPCQLILSSVSAFAFTFFEFPLKNLLFTVYLTTMMIPGEVIVIANYMTIQNLGLMNTYAGLTLTSLVGAGSIFMLRQNMKSLPKELWEAAVLDGCSEMKYFWRVVLPLSRPILAAMGITSFVGSYNAYLWPLLATTKSEMYTIQIGMAQLMGEAAYGYGYVLAGAVLCMLVPMLTFFFAQDLIVKGMTAGAVKS